MRFRPDPVFVGRRDELAALGDAFDLAARGQSTLVLMEAAGGDGKSALVAEFAASRTCPVVLVAGDEDESLLAYGLYDRLVANLGAAGGQEGVRDAGVPGRTGPGVRRDVQLTGAELLDRLRGSHGGQPQVLIVDDAHLADRESLAALGYAVRRLEAEPLLTVLTVRPDGVVRLPTGLVKQTEQHGVRLVLGGLQLGEVRELVRVCGQVPISDRLARELLERTGGSPLHIRTLLQERASIGVDLLTDRLPPPSSFAHLVGQQLAELSEESRRLVTAAAVLGLRTSLRMATSVAGVTEVFAAVDEAQAARIVELVPGGAGADLAFTHALVRAAVYDNTSQAVRAVLHRAAAQLTSGNEALTHLAAATPGFDIDLAERFEAAAAGDAAGGAWRAAAHTLLQAARLHPPGVQHDDAFLRGIDALLIAGDPAAVSAELDAIVGLPESLQRTQVLARIAWLSGRFDEAEALAEQAWASADELDDLARDRLAGLLAQMCLMQGKNLPAIEWGYGALRSGRLDSRSQASTTATLAAALGLEGRADEALKLLPDDGDPNDAGYRELVGMRGILHVLAGDPDSGVRDLRVRLRPNVVDHSRGQTAVDLLTATGPDGFEPNKLIVMTFLVQAEYRRGNWDVAAAIAEQAVSLIDDTEQFWIAPMVHAAATLVPAARGHWQVAESHANAAQAAAAQFGDELNRGYAANAAVHLAACRGEPAQVVAAADWLIHQAQPYHQEPGLHSWPVHCAAALVALGDHTEAAALIDRWENAAVSRGRRASLAAFARVRGELHARRRDFPAARQAFANAERIGQPCVDADERIQLLLSRGSFLRRRGERRAALSDLTEAERQAATVDAQPLLGRIRAQLAASGHVTPATDSTTKPSSGLTPQEAAVARLVVSGMSNRQVADALVITPKTVAYHLGNVYAKFGVTTRAQLLATQLSPPPHSTERDQTSPIAH